MATDIKDLAISYWRMEKWLSNTNVERKMAASSALRTIKRFLDSHKIEVLDLLGQHFDSGLAVDVINNDVPEGTDDNSVIITEMIKPIIMQDGSVIQFGQVSIGLTVKKTIENNTKEKEESDDLKQIKDMTSEIVKLSKYVKMQSNNKNKIIGYVIGALLLVFMVINAFLLISTKTTFNNQIQNLYNITKEKEEKTNKTNEEDIISNPNPETTEKNIEVTQPNNGIMFKKYKIKSGDSILSICKENGISYAENIEYIKNINGLTDINKIYVGQQILLPIITEEEN